MGSLGDLIRKERKRQKMTQGEAGAALGVDQSTVARWEDGQEVRRRHYEAVAKFLNMTLAEVGSAAAAELDPGAISDMNRRVAALEESMREIRRVVFEMARQLEEKRAGRAGD